MKKETYIYRFMIDGEVYEGTASEIAEKSGIQADDLRAVKFETLFGSNPRIRRGKNVKFIDAIPRYTFIITSPTGIVTKGNFPKEISEKIGYSYAAIYQKLKGNEGMKGWKVERYENHFGDAYE